MLQDVLISKSQALQHPYFINKPLASGKEAVAGRVDELLKGKSKAAAAKARSLDAEGVHANDSIDVLSVSK